MSETVLRVHAGAAPPARGSARFDLHLYASLGEVPPEGTAVDDLLEPGERRAADEQAHRDLAAWQERWSEPLTVSGACLPWIHAVDLLVDVFHRERHALTGFERALATRNPATVEVWGADPALASALAALASTAGARLTTVEPGPPPSHPMVLATAVVPRGRLGAVRETVGLPALVRGDVLIQPPDSHLSSVRAGLAERGCRLVEDPSRLPALPPRELLGRLRRGGLMAHPGRRTRSRARRVLDEALAHIPARDDGEDPVAALQHERALGLLRQRAGTTLADLEAARASLARGRLRSVITGSDAHSAARVLAIAGRESGVPTTEVLHGFSLGLWSADGTMAPTCDGMAADRVAGWSEHDVEVLGPVARGQVEVTGNPGAAPGIERLAGLRADSGSYALVLVQSTGWAVSALGARAPLAHARGAVAALTAARPGLPIVLRPHPFDRTPFGPLLGDGTTLGDTGPLEPLLAGASLVVGSLTTATLEAAAAGVPTVLLDASGAPAWWPFDGSGALPKAHTAAELESLLGSIGQEAEDGVVADARRALGVRDDAVERVIELATRQP